MPGLANESIGNSRTTSFSGAELIKFIGGISITSKMRMMEKEDEKRARACTQLLFTVIVLSSRQICISQSDELSDSLTTCDIAETQ